MASTSEENQAEKDSGVAKLKPEFLLPDYKRTLITEYVSDKVRAEMDAQEEEDKREDGGQPASKRIKLKGRNKQRPRSKKIDPGDKICPTVTRGEVCPYGESCKFSHDKAKFMSQKEPDISDDCYVFKTYGKCPYGLSCRFSSKHVTSNYENVINKEIFAKCKPREATVTNMLKKDVQVLLWKRKYDFRKANAVISEVDPKYGKKGGGFRDRNGPMVEEKQEIKPENADIETNISMAIATNSNSNDITSDTINTSTNGNTSCDANPSVDTVAVPVNGDPAVNINSNCSLGNDVSEAAGGKGGGAQDTTTNTPIKVGEQKVTLDEEGVIRLRPQEKKKIDFRNKLYLAPLTTVGNLPFRRVCKRLGADITCGEMAVATQILQGKANEWALLKRHESEDLFGVQICGGFPDVMTRTSQLITEHLDVDFVDINCGCPIDLIFHKGEGCALMGRSNRFEQIIKGMTSVLEVPLTVKMRTGIYGHQNIAHYLVPKLKKWGVALTTIHGRSREQRYTKSANWEYINECAKLAEPMPLFGNGDVLSYHEYNERMETTGVSGLMLARGALIKPWIFTEIKEQKDWDISASERFDLLRDYVNYGLEHWGSDRQGVETTRRFLLEWLSFLYRYIPVGILEQPPQKINERPPYYKGRNELETMMSSPSCDDWVKISEMLLGKVPEDFSFLPKHKANAYK